MKIIKLIQNETIKTFKKTSTLILIALVIASLFAAVGLSKLIMSLNGFVGSYMDENEDWQKTTKDKIAEMKRTVEAEKENYSKETIADLNANIKTYEVALKSNINYIYYQNPRYWKIQTLSEIHDTEYNLIINEENLTSEEKERQEKNISDKAKVLEEDNYLGYIDLLKNNAKVKLDNKAITKEEYDDEIYLLELRVKYNLFTDEKWSYNWKENIYENISTIKTYLRTGINQSTGKLLKVEEIEGLKDNLKIAEYRLENDIPELDSGSSERSLYDMFAPTFTLGLFGILMIIIMGSAISTEISKGTIKFLLFTPNKRWKVLLSKIISAVLILFVLTLIVSLLSVIIGNIFFKDPGNVYLYVSNGEVKLISNLPYTILYFLISDIDILMYMLFALMLSTITKNTALSVGVSIACYIGAGTIMQLINYYIKADWVKFIPFNNLGIVDSVFTNNYSYSTMQSMAAASSGTSAGFSLGVLAVCAVLMIITMFDSFNKKDIV